MIEYLNATLAKSSGTTPPGVGDIFDLNFENAALGSKVIVDGSPNNVQFETRGTTTSNFGVTSVDGLGKCFQFNGSGFFYAANNPLKNFSLGSYDLQLGFLKPNTTYAIPFSTGSWVSSVNPGTSVMLDQVPSTWFQMFLFYNPNYQRNQGFGTNPKVYQEFLVQKRKAGMTIKNLTTASSMFFNPFEISSDSELSIGSHKDGNALTGYLKYLRITKVVE